MVACGQKDGGIAIWRLDSGGFGKPEHTQLLWGHGGHAVQKLAFHPEGDLLASASKRGGCTLENWHPSALPIWKIKMKIICFSASFSESGTLVNVWSLSASTVVSTSCFPAAPASFSGSFFSPSPPPSPISQSNESYECLGLAWYKGAQNHSLIVAHTLEKVRLRFY